jgi:hypothetical protein
MIAIGTEQFDLFVPQLLPVTVEFPFALGTGRPKYFRHGSSWYQIIFTAETQSTEFGIFPKEKIFPQRPQRLRGAISDSLSA